MDLAVLSVDVNFLNAEIYHYHFTNIVVSIALYDNIVDRPFANVLLLRCLAEGAVQVDPSGMPTSADKNNVYACIRSAG